MNHRGKNSTGYTWLRDALSPAGSAFLGTIWLYPWICLALASARYTAHLRISVFWITGLIAIPALAGRWLERSFSRHLILRRLALLLMVILLLLLFVRTQTLPGGSIADPRWLGQALWPFATAEAPDRQNLILFGWIVACILLLGGVGLAEGEITGETAPRWFLGGLVGFLLLFVVVIHAPAAYAPDQNWLGPLLVLYVFLGLGWVALIQRGHVEERTFRRSPSGVNLAWLLLFALIGVAMVLVAMLATFLGMLTFHHAAHTAVVLLSAAWKVGAVLRHGLAAAYFFLLHGILHLLGLLPHGPASPGSSPPGAAAPSPLLPRSVVQWLVSALLVGIVVLGVLAVVCGIALILYLAGRLLLGRHRVAPTMAGGDQRVSLWSWNLFLTQLRGLVWGLSRVWRFRLKRSRALSATESDSLPFPPLDSIRELYRSMLRFCRGRGRPRRPDETPGEFEPVLSDHVPPDLAHRMTRAYSKVRYGRASLTREEIDFLARWWQEYQRETADQPSESPDRPLP